MANLRVLQARPGSNTMYSVVIAQCQVPAPPRSTASSRVELAFPGLRSLRRNNGIQNNRIRRNIRKIEPEGRFSGVGVDGDPPGGRPRPALSNNKKSAPWRSRPSLNSTTAHGHVVRIGPFAPGYLLPAQLSLFPPRYATINCYPSLRRAPSARRQVLARLCDFADPTSCSRH